LVVTRPADWYYLTGFTGEAGVLIVTNREAVLVTDGRFTVQANAETSGVKVVLQVGGLFELVGRWLAGGRRKRVGFDPQQVTISQLRALRRSAKRQTRLVAAPGQVADIRTRKDASEIAQMRKAALLASDVVARVARMLKPGIRELEVAAEVE